MLGKNDHTDKKLHSKRVRDGIAQAKAQGRKLGRPTVAEVKGDTNLAARASELRDIGLSWSQIASNLGVGRTTARRLTIAYQKEKSRWTREDSNPSVPKAHVSDTPESKGQYIAFSIDDDILGKLPKTFQMFSVLLEKARKAQETGREI